ncbi:hypothetical protein [Nocardia suismassiliense]|uniref:hypothetical protein n=1 Tax=Nocardia suismassiliense TaxID=2077092 RepID=UPI001F406CBA|nr:hypothetical protein [Nocardia suismassiliense]
MHLAVAPGGADGACTGLGTQLPRELMYESGPQAEPGSLAGGGATSGTGAGGGGAGGGGRNATVVRGTATGGGAGATVVTGGLVVVEVGALVVVGTVVVLDGARLVELIVVVAGKVADVRDGAAGSAEQPLTSTTNAPRPTRKPRPLKR